MALDPRLEDALQRYAQSYYNAKTAERLDEKDFYSNPRALETAKFKCDEAKHELWVLLENQHALDPLHGVPLPDLTPLLDQMKVRATSTRGILMTHEGTQYAIVPVMQIP